MNIKRIIALATLAGMLSLSAPAVPVRADGAASTRNIFLGIGAAAATYLIIQHNRKVHQKYAEDAQRQAALEQQNNNAWGAYRQERQAYQQEVAVNAELKREIAYQHQVVEQERRQLGVSSQQSVVTPNGRVAMTSYGWGSL